MGWASPHQYPREAPPVTCTHILNDLDPRDFPGCPQCRARLGLRSRLRNHGSALTVAARQDFRAEAADMALLARLALARLAAGDLSGRRRPSPPAGDVNGQDHEHPAVDFPALLANLAALADAYAEAAL